MKLATTILLGLAVCFAVVNAMHRRSSEDAERQYDGHDPPTEFPKEEAGPVEEKAGEHGTEPGEETGEKAGGEEPGAEGGEETEGEGGEETGGEPEEKATEMGKHAKGMSGDTDAEKHRGFCHWGIAAWFKPGFSQRCGCMKCTCKEGGEWKCGYNFAYCPYFYCGNEIFSPHEQLCCCGKVHDKKAHHSCCGYNYYDMRHNKCCNYYSVKPMKSHCPRDRI